MNSLGKALPGSLTLVSKTLRKDQAKLGWEVLRYRYENKLDLWSGIPLLTLTTHAKHGKIGVSD